MDIDPGEISEKRGGSIYFYMRNGLYMSDGVECLCISPGFPLQRGYPESVIDLNTEWDHPSVATNIDKIFVAHANYSFEKGYYSANLNCINQTDHKLCWQVYLPNGGHGEVFASTDGGCFVFQLNIKENCSYISKISMDGKVSWSHQTEKIIGIGPRHPSDCIYLITENRKKQNSLLPEYKLVQLYEDGTLLSVEKYLDSTPCAIKFDYNNDVWVILQSNNYKTPFYTIKKYSTIGSRTLNVNGRWDFSKIRPVGKWGISPSGKYFAIRDYITRPNGELTNRVILIHLEEEGHFSIFPTPIEGVLDAASLAPIVTDTGTIFSAWRHRPSNQLVVTDKAGVCKVVRKSNSKFLAMRVDGDILYSIEGSKTKSQFVISSLQSNKQN